ncbi:MAG: phospho-sugar mutase [Firmicutes bacterium]|nr:phospho-sugar mutase [Bacillota bacterium]MCL1954028.1 phospho-sugar mutase [Bacillota bacterium]
MTAQQKYKLWCDSVDSQYLSQLQSMQGDNLAIEDAFSKDLEFGTAGMRGLMGMGSNRINVYTIKKATIGIAKYLQQTNQDKNIKVVVSYDNRRDGKLFAQIVSRVLENNNISCQIFQQPTPTPILVYATRYLDCDLGIMITASHNPKEYNGYKIFERSGSQVIDTTLISQLIDEVDVFQDIVDDIGFDVKYLDDSIVQQYFQELNKKYDSFNVSSIKDIKVVYTPLNGTGSTIVPELLARYGNCPFVVPEQGYCNPDFETCPNPNPEHLDSFELGLKYAKLNDADIVVATDPDADRIGVMVRHGDGYVYINGNQMGILLTEFLLSQNATSNNKVLNPIVVRTIVTGNLVDKIADKYGATIRETLTGFKYIGNIIRELRENSEEHRYLIGFEESMGYLIGTHVGDKDAMITVLAIMQLMAYCKAKNISLIEKLNEIYSEFGYFSSQTLSLRIDTNKVQSYLNSLRQAPPTNFASYLIQSFQDYSNHTNKLMCANVLSYKLENGVSVILRPSGTEPLLKIYLMASLTENQNNKIIGDLKTYFSNLKAFA